METAVAKGNRTLRSRRYRGQPNLPFDHQSIIRWTIKQDASPALFETGACLSADRRGARGGGGVLETVL
jgi:hypothetical protein